MEDFPKRLVESKYIHSDNDDYPVNLESRELRLRMEERQGLPQGEVATYTGRLVLGVRKDGKIIDKKTGSFIAVDPNPSDSII